MMPPPPEAVPSPAEVVDFAPADYTDGRKPLEWKTRYPPEARRQIRWEAFYVGATFIAFMAGTFIALSKVSTTGGVSEGTGDRSLWLGCVSAWIGGTVGGALFGLKWLYHSVAKGIWNEDRRLWRLFAPHMSGAVALFTVLLTASGLLQIFNQHLIEQPLAVLGFAFLVGYFSDKALAKLAETADTLFGAITGR